MANGSRSRGGPSARRPIRAPAAPTTRDRQPGPAAGRTARSGRRPGPGATGRPNAGPARGPRHVVGPVPAVARVAAGLALVGAVLLVGSGLLPYADVGGRQVPGSVAAALAGLPWPLALAAAAVAVIRGLLPRLGLAAIGVSGALAAGLAVGQGYLLVGAGGHRAVEVFRGARMVTSELVAGPGVVLALAAYVLLALALVATLVAWPRTAMEDAGEFDLLRSRALVASAVIAVTGGLSVVAPVHTAADDVLVGLTGLRTTLEVPADVALPERLGLDLLGGSILTAAVVVTALLAATLRPRLASVGAYAALATYFLSAGLVAQVEVGRPDGLLVGAGGWLLLVAAALSGVTAGWALRAGPPVAADEGTGALGRG